MTKIGDSGPLKNKVFALEMRKSGFAKSNFFVPKAAEIRGGRGYFVGNVLHG